MTVKLAQSQLPLAFDTPPQFACFEPVAPPSLRRHPVVVLDVETTGLRWWAGHKPVGIGVGLLDPDVSPGSTPEDRWYYLPFGHTGGNLDEEAVRRWARRELRNKTCIFHNGQFDIQQFRVWGVDLEEQGCRPVDTIHMTALLDEHRFSYSLDNVAKDLLGIGKIRGLDKTRMASYHAAEVHDYAIRDVKLTGGIYRLELPQIKEQELERVLDLESRCIYVTCEMMRNGAPVDEEKLNAWEQQAREDYFKTLWEIHRTTGMVVDPASGPSKTAFFRKLGVKIPTKRTPGPDYGKPTFERAELKLIKHPAIQLLYRATRLKSLLSKYLVKYREQVALNGRLLYSLHQTASDEGGTVSGRYSSSRFNTPEDDGINIQQVAGKKHAKAMTDGESDDSLHDLVGEDLAHYKIRELFIPSKKRKWLKADAAQIEYRLFAHYGKPPRVLAAYAKDPETDFHNIVWDMLKEVMKDIDRPTTKDTNFAKIYGASLKKIAAMLQLSIEEARVFVAQYDRTFPEAQRLMDRVMRVAKERGFVRTLLGRRARFPGLARLHAALNRVIQGTAAEEMKTKAVALHDARRETGFKLRFVVHDEVDGDIEDIEGARKVARILNTQILKTRVPLLWEVGMGANWQEAEDASSDKKRRIVA